MRAGPSPCSSSRPRRAYLGGGTNLVDLMRLGVATPDAARGRGAAAARPRRGDARRGLRIGAAVRNSDAAAHPLVRERFPLLASAILHGASGQLRNLATTGGNLLQRTRCVYFQDVSKPCNKREPGSGCPAREGEHHNLAILGWSEQCVATHPSDMAVALAALDAIVHLQGPDGERSLADRRPAPAAGRGAAARHCARSAASSSRPSSCPRSPFATRGRYEKVRERASFAFAVVSLAAALDVEDGMPFATCGSRSAAWRTSRGGRCLPSGRCAARAASREAFARAADAELSAARPLRDNAYKLPLARTLIVETLLDLAERGMSVARQPALGSDLDRIEAREKVTGAATYAFEYEHDDVAYAAIVQSTIAKGAITACDDAAAREMPGVLAVLWAGSAPRLHEADGRAGAVPVAQGLLPRADRRRRDREEPGDRAAGSRARPTSSTPRSRPTAGSVSITPASTSRTRSTRASRRTPTRATPMPPSAGADVSIDVTYETPAFHNNPMEPHATAAVWHPDGGLTLYDSTQGASSVRDTVAKAFGLAPDRVRVVAPHVGGGFGSKGTPRPHVILAAMAATAVQGAVKIAVTRQEMFAFTGYRTPTIQRLQLGASGDGRLAAIAHDVVEQTSTVQEFAEQTAVVTRMLYASPNRRTTHRLAALDVPTPSWMRAPGECPGMYALESAMDELAVACGLDPIELRVRNEPDVDPETGHAVLEPQPRRLPARGG